MCDPSTTYGIAFTSLYVTQQQSVNMVMPSYIFIGLTNPAVLLLLDKISGDDLHGHVPSVSLCC